MPDLLLLRDLALALGLGLLIGIERGWRTRDAEIGSRVAGVRTFGLLGAAGGLAGIAANALGPAAAAAILAGVAATIAIGYASKAKPGAVSATSAIAAVVTLALGALTTVGYPAVAFASAAVLTLLLASRAQLHRAVAALGERDVQAVARFAIVAGAILPFLPNRHFGPYDAWNPFQLWFVVVLVTGFSFAGYIANRLIGARQGTLVTAAIGGMYSSTAVTVVLSRQLKDQAEGGPMLSAGIALASAIMFIRVLLLTAIIAPFALLPLAKVIGPAAVIAIGLGFWLIRSATETKPDQALPSTGNPFALLPAIGFAALVAAMALAARWAEQQFGDAGIAVLLAITGSFDVDAAIVTLGGFPRGTVPAATAGIVLAIPVALNTGFKASLVLLYAGWSRGRTAFLALATCAAAILLVAAASWFS